MPKNAPKKRTSDATPAAPEAVPFGAPPAADRPRIAETTDYVMAILAARHGDEMRANPKQFKEAIVQEIRRRMTIRKGRPRAVHLDAAERLRAQGLTFHNIAIRVEPRYSEWNRYRQREYCEQLRQALRARKKRSQLLSPRKNDERVILPSAS